MPKIIIIGGGFAGVRAARELAKLGYASTVVTASAKFNFLPLLPEVVGGAALTVDPHSPAEMARAMERLLSDRALATQLAAAGRLRAREFTWEKTALATKAFFEGVG